jgi:hypothetical protein
MPEKISAFISFLFLRAEESHSKIKILLKTRLKLDFWFWKRRFVISLLPDGIFLSVLFAGHRKLTEE